MIKKIKVTITLDGGNSFFVEHIFTGSGINLRSEVTDDFLIIYHKDGIASFRKEYVVLMEKLT